MWLFGIDLLGCYYNKNYYNITLRFFCIWVRVDLGYELTWVWVDRGYELTWVRVDRGYELTWVWVDLVRVDFGYELTVYPILYCLRDIATYWSKTAKFLYPTRRGDPVKILPICLILIKLEWLGYRVVKKLRQYVKPRVTSLQTIW